MADVAATALSDGVPSAGLPGARMCWFLHAFAAGVAGRLANRAPASGSDQTPSSMKPTGDPASVEGGNNLIAGLFAFRRVLNVTVLFAARSVAISDCGCANQHTRTDSHFLLSGSDECVLLTAFNMHVRRMRTVEPGSFV